MLSLTDSAVEKVKGLLTEEEDSTSLALRVAVRPGGCSGFSYDMFFDSETSDDDTRIEYNGINVIIDAASADLLKGSTLDYKDGLQSTGFSIENPNAKKSCGCGQSFC